jgi:hypothetical protein
MPRFEESKTNQNQPTNPSANQANSTSANQNTPPATKTQSGLLTMIGQLLPLAPFAFEQFTGQKVPHLTGTIAEMQMALVQIQTGLQTIVSNQQALSQRLIALETNANNHLTNLTQQFNSLRLTHTQEKKQIEFNPSKLENQTDY